LPYPTKSKLAGVVVAGGFLERSWVVSFPKIPSSLSVLIPVACICRMFNQIIAGKSLPRHLSSDHDPLFRFHRWLANLRILEVEEIKSIPYVPVSHPFVERLIGTIRREFLDHVLIWNAIDLGRKLEEFRIYYNENRVHQSLSGSTPGERSGEPPPAHAVLDHYAWRYHCRGLFQMPIAA
jgi:putative transposase